MESTALRLHLGDKNGFTLYLAVLGLQLFDQGHAMALLLLTLLFKIFTRNFLLSLISLLGSPAKMGG